MPIEDPNPRISVVENRADNAKALFELLEQRRKQAAEAQPRSPGQPVQNQVSPALGRRVALGTLPAPGLGAATIKPAEPVSELPERLEDFPSTASTRALTGTIDHESSLDELKEAISKGKFDVKSYLGAVDNMPGGIHGLLTPEEVEKMQEAYRFQMTKPVSPAVVAKTAVTGAVTTAPAIVRGAYKTGKDLASIEMGVRRAALGDKSGLKDAEAASAEIVAGAEVGFLGAADAARRGIRRGVDVLKQAATGDVKSITDVALSANPLMVPFNIFGVRPTDFIPGSKKEDAKSLTPTDPDLWRQRFWEDIASAKQMDLASRGEGEFGKAAIGGGERTARQVALDATGEWDEKAPGDIGMIYNPYMAAGTIANLLKRARAGGLTPRPAQIKAPPAKAQPQPRLGGAMTATGSVIERSGTSAIRHMVPGVGFAGYTFGPTGAILGATMPWIIRWAGRKMKKTGQARAKGGTPPDPNFGVALAQGVKDNVLKPYYEGAKGAALHPMTIGLAAFADDDQEMGHIFGGAAAFGGVTHLGIHTVNVGAGRAHGVLMADRIKQTQLREEPFDPNYGRHAEPTQRNLQRMSESDRTVVNILRNKVRQANVAEPDMDAIRTQPPKLNAREWVTEQISSETGQVGYRTNLGRVVSPTEAGRIAWEAGQPLRDVTYQVEIVASDPETASAVSNPEMSHSLGANASGSKRGVVNAYREGDAGRIEVHLNSDAFSAYHELGHALDFARHPGERLGLRNELLQTHGKQSIEAFRRFYAELLASGELAALQRARASAVDPQLRAQIDTRIDSVRRTGYWKPDPGMPPRDASRPHVVGDAGQSKFVVDDGAGKRSVVDMNTAIDIADANGQTRVSRDIALDEASAEMQSMMLKSRSLQGLPESSRQKVAGALASLLEDVGLYKAGFSATQGQYTRMQRPGDPTSPSSTARQQSTLGLEASMNAERAYWRNLRSVAGPQRIPGAVDIAPPGPEFFGTEGPGGTAQQRVAGGLTPGEPVAAADRPIVQTPTAPTGAAPVVTPKGPTPVRPGIVTREENRTVVDTGRATDAEVNSILQGLRDSGLPEAEIARLEPMLRAKGGTVELTYASGTPDLLPPAELARERRAERRATYEREQGAVNEELRKIAPETRTKFTRKFVPYRVIVRPALNPDGTTTVQANVLGLSPSKVLQNAIILDRTVRNINAKVAPEQRMVLPFQEPAERGQAVYNYERLYQALEQYTENQANGYTGAGEKLTRPEGFIEVIPEPVEGYTPHKLPQIEASFINMLMGVEPPVTTRSTKRMGAVTPEGIRAIPTGEKVQAGIETVEIQPKAVSAFQLSEAQAPGRGVPSPTRDVGIAGPRTAPAKPWEVAVPTRAMRKGMPATEVKKGTFKDPKTGVEFDIQEFNQLRAEITDKARRAGLKEFDLNDHLAEAFEELNAELLESVRVSPREEGPQLRYPSETMVEAGFLPEEAKARLIPAVKTAEGRVIPGEKGKTHDDIYKSMGVDGLMLQVEGPEHGFIDTSRPGEFMSREQAGEKTGVKGRLHSQDLIEAKAMPEASPELQARAEAKKQTIRENEGVGIGVNRRTKAAPYPAKSQSGKAAEQDGFSLNQWESEGGFGIVQMKDPEGKRVGDVVYRVQELDSGELDYHVQFIDVLPEWRGDAARFEGNNAAAILYRELAETAKENGVLRISGDPISERAMALRMKVFEQTEVTDPVSEAPMVKAEDLRAAIQDSGGLIPFMKEQGMFELTSFFRENHRFLPEEVEVPVMASVRLKRGAGGKGETFDGPMHLFAYTKAREKTGSTDFADFEEGFKTSKGRFVSRQEAADLANKNAGLIIKGELMAEELPAQREAIRVAQDLNLQFQGSPLEGRWQFHDPVTRSGFTARAGEPIEAIRQRLEATRQEFGEERAMPKEQRDLELKHYSNVPNLKVLDPAKHGTGIPGAEATRRRDYPEIYLPRTYYGLKGYKKEPGLGPYTYESAIKSSRVYDFLKDPDNFYPDSTELRDAGYAPFDQTAAVTLYENRIAKKYDGFKNTSVKVAALFKKQPVKQIGESRALPGEDLLPEKARGKDDVTIWFGKDRGNPRVYEKKDYHVRTVDVPNFYLDREARTLEVLREDLFSDGEARYAADVAKALGLDIIKRNGDPIEDPAILRKFGFDAEVLPAETARKEFAPFIEEEPPIPYPKLEEGAVAKLVNDSENTIEPAWLLRNGKSMAVETKGFYHSDAVHGFAEFNRSENRKLIGEAAVAKFQADTGAVRLATFSSGRSLLDYGGTLGISTSRKPSEGQLSAIAARLRDKITDTNGSEKNTFDRVNAEYQTADGRPFASIAVDINTPADIRTVMQFLRDPFSVEGASFVRGAPAESVREIRSLPGEADLFGQVDYEGKAIQGMSDRQLRSHFPEAIVPKGRQPKRIEYDLTKAPLVKGLDPEQAAGKYADKIKEFYESVKYQPEVQAGRRWYSEFTPELKKAFGKDAPVFAELLAATSPNTSPEINFGFAADAFFNFKAGRYDANVKTFMQGLRLSESGEWKAVYQQAVDAGAKRTGAGEPTQAEFMAWWIADNNLKPRGSGGKLIGMHSTQVLQVLARKWMETNEGPKTQTFVSNLLGAGHEATIDVWAARTMRRLGYEGSRERWRILPENSTGVSDADFALAQKAFKQASRDLGMRPSSLQGALWFAEKKLWADRGWGRLDMGDFRSEMKKLNLLKARFTESEAVRERAKDIETTEQEDLFGGG